MTKTMTIHTNQVRRTSGFTLIEMLVVAALIAIFAGLAVFNIVEQLNREKEKAALAEARSIATAMSFVYDDMGFFPKLCFLRFGLDELTKVITDKSLPNDSIEYFGFPNPTMANRLKTNWGDKYMAGSMPEKFSTMQVQTSSGVKDFDWPRDPFKTPYVAYLVKMDSPTPNGTKVPMWLENVGEKANYFAGIVSYGRNRVPGLKWDDTPGNINARVAGRLFIATPTDNVYQLPSQTPNSGNSGFYNDARLNLLAYPSTDPLSGAAANQYTIREAGSDDKFFEF